MRKPRWLANARVDMVLDMSTAHVTKKDTELLDVRGNCENPIITYSYAEGFFIIVPCSTPKGKALPAETRRELEQFGYSKEFITILEMCVNQNMRYLRLDADGETYDDDQNKLPIFDW